MKRITRAQAAGSGTRPADPSTFTGPVLQQAVNAVTEAQLIRTLLVTFEDGARTHWHRHAGGQVLQIVAGAGRICARGGETVDLEPGDIVVAEPGEEHWHGAAEGATMTHLAISIGPVSWGGVPE